MRKISFYPKLALSNLWRNKTTYIPYLIANITGVATMYILLAIFSSESILALRGAMYVQSIMMIGIFLLGILVLALLLWTNSFLLKRRRKELGLYSVLGMEKRNMALLMLFETLFTAAVALLVGIGAGMLFARLVFLGLLKIVQYKFQFTLVLSAKAVFQTVGFFLVLYLIMLLHNLRQVGRVKPVEIMAGASQGEKEPKASWLITLLGLVFLAFGYGFALTVEDPAWALLFFLVAAISVILGTYCLFVSGSIAVLKFMRRRKGYYYTPKHFISVSGMIYRMKQNAAGLATICILSCMVLVTVSATVTLYTGSQYSYDYPRDYKTTYTRFAEATGPDLDAYILQQAAEESGTQLTDVLAHRLYYISVWGVGEGAWESENAQTGTLAGSGAPYAQVKFVPVEDYNALHGTNYTLQNGQALLLYAGFAADNSRLAINGMDFDIVARVDNFLGRPNNEETYNTEYYLFVTEADFAAAVQAHNRYWAPEELALDYPNGIEHIIHFNLSGGLAEYEAFSSAYWTQWEAARLGDNEGFAATMWFTDSWEAESEWYAMNGGFLFLGIFFGVLFLAAATLIIYYKQVSEGYQDRERFSILQKVGMSEREVKKTINSQVRSVFFLPLGVALVHIFVAYRCIARALVIFDITNLWVQLVATAATFLVYVLLYYIVYKQTAKTYFKIVRHAAA